MSAEFAAAGRAPRGRGRRRGRSAVFVGTVVAALAGCDLVSSSGPGITAATVTGNAELGAIVLDVTWRGVKGFSGRGTTQVYWAPVAGSPDRHRVVLLDPAGGDIRFGIDVEDVRAEIPTVVIVSASDTSNQPIPVAGLRVSLGR